MSEEPVLEQRERKPRKAATAEANGHSSDVPDFAAAEDFGADEVAGDSTDVPEPEDVEEASTSNNKIYFVRVPRPPINDEVVKKLSAQFTDQVAKLKGMNAKLATKREELREFRRQLGVGRSLKDGSQPEYEEKLNRLQQLRSLRNNYQDKMSKIRETLRGLDCKSEEELEAKVKELEERISHGSLLLREEKQIVGQISRLQSQRTQIRDYDNQKTQLTELETENNKVKTVMAELEEEFKILKAERDQAQGIIKEILTKVKACEAEVKDLEEEQKDAVAAKNDALAALDKARGEMNDSMSDYRDNRSFSLKVRDLVTLNRVEEARALCKAQVDDMVARIASETAFRKEYYSLWAAQRKYAVSELLPDSTTVVKEVKAEPAGKAGGKGKGGDAKGAKAPPPKPQGAEKAKLLIEQLMAEAQLEASKKAGVRTQADDGSGDADDEEEDVTLPEPAAPVVEPVAAKPRPAVSARPADVLKMVELPKIEDVEFVPPVIKTEAEIAAAKAAQDKDRLREEQIKKAQEAELRKKKLAEAKEKKKKESEAKRKADEEARKAEAAVLEAERAKQQAAERAEAEAKRKAAEAAAKAAAEAKASYNPAAKVIAKSQVTVAAKAKKPANDPLRYWRAFKKNTTLQLGILAGVLSLLMLYIIIMAMRS